MFLRKEQNMISMRKSVIIIIIVTLISVVLICFFVLRDNREDKLIKEGNAIVEKVEHYRQVHNRLPNTLEEIGIEEEEGLDVLYYYKRDSLNYTVSFPVSPEEHKFYYSDSKKWESGFREMGSMNR